MDGHPANIVRLTARVPQVMGRMESIMNVAVPDRVLEERSASTTSSSADSTSSCGASGCEKPVSSATFTLPIILGIA
jgi:hypothetical protein